MTEQLQAKASPTSPPRMTYAQFLEWDGENQHVEWVNGEVVKMAPISDEHQFLVTFLIVLFRTFCDKNKAGKVLCDPFQMKTGPDLPGRAPDVLVVLQKNLDRLKRLYVDGPADLVVEVISPGSRGIDRGDKFFEYEAGGVPEYWLIDPMRKQVEFYVLGPDKQLHVTMPADGVFHSQVLPGLWVKTDWFWQQPDVLDVLREWKLI